MTEWSILQAKLGISQRRSVISHCGIAISQTKLVILQTKLTIPQCGIGKLQTMLGILQAKLAASRRNMCAFHRFPGGLNWVRASKTLDESENRERKRRTEKADESGSRNRRSSIYDLRPGRSRLRCGVTIDPR